MMSRKTTSSPRSLLLNCLTTLFLCISYTSMASDTVKNLPEKTLLNNNLLLFQAPKDCWRIIASFLNTNDKLNLRLLATSSNTLFNSADEAPTIQIKKAWIHLPPHKKLDEKLKKKIILFASTCCIDSIVIKNPEKELPLISLIGPYIRKIRFEIKTDETKVSSENLQPIINACPLIESINLNSTYIQPQQFQYLDWSKLQKLNDLTFRHTGILNTEVKKILILFHFKKLRISRISDTDFDWTKQNTLKKLSCKYCSLANTNFQKILDTCCTLTELNLSASKPSMFNSLNWKNQQYLKKLFLSDSITEDKNLQKILNVCHFLKKLDLSWCNYLPFSTLNWKNQSKLKELNLCYTKIKDKGLQDILNNCSLIENLNLRWCNTLKLTALNWKNQKNLKILKLSFINRTEQGLQNILNACHFLTNLKLDVNSNNNKLTGNSLNWENQRHLKKLNLSGVDLEDKGLQNIITHCPLTYLNLTDCKQLAFVTLKWQNQKELKHLDLRATSITDKGLQEILNNCPNLETLNVDGCRMLKFTELNWQKQSRLKKLIVTNTVITKKSLLDILALCLKLSQLNVFKIIYNTKEKIYELWSFITDKLAKKKVDQRLENIYCIDLSKTSLTKENLQFLLTTCTSLIKLNLNNCATITFDTIDWKNQKHLQVILLQNTTISLKNLALLLNSCPTLTELDLSDCTKLPEKIRTVHSFGTVHKLQKIIKQLLI